MKTQVQLEEEMSLLAQARGERIEEGNELSGNASRNAYGGFLAARFTKPLHDIIVEDLNDTGPRVGAAALIYLRQVDPAVAAYIAVRTVINEVIRNDQPNNFRKVVTHIGRLIQYETVLGKIKLEDVKTFNKVKNYLTDNAMVRPDIILRTMTREAAKKGINPSMWQSGAYEYVGAYLIGRLEQLGLCDVDTSTISKPGRGKYIQRKVQTLMLTADVYTRISELKEMVKETTPFFLPCIEPPMDWVDVDDGGYHTPAMRRLASSAILGGSCGGDTSVLLGAINALQRTAWSINTEVLEVAKKIQTIEDGDEIVSTVLPTPPPKPGHLEGKTKKELVGEEKNEHTKWRLKMREWGRATSLRRQKIGRMISVFDVATMFQEYPEIYFVYHADFRGRVYPHATGPSPQGSDLQKAVLHFAKAKPVKSEEAQEWFLYQGANKYGQDKLTLPKKLEWVADNHDMFIAIATDPIATRGMWYREADSPFQFLAWCFEYKRFCEEGPAFVSRLPISMDGSCNGLQNFSALLLDEVGGKATNLTDGDPSDIYSMVAELTRKLIESYPEDDAGMRSKWLKHGIARKAVKRTVMTLPYGATRYSARNFILDDYLREVQPVEFEVWEYKTAAQYLSEVVWIAISQVVVKAREAMDWLQGAVRPILATDTQYIEWEAPSGLLVRQRYRGFKKTGSINVECMGGIRFNMSTDSKVPDLNRHVNGLAPNFVHSMDASHMAAVSVAAAKEGIKSLAMIHDDFGTHAADTPALARIIREEFVKQYSGKDWIKEFKDRYEALGVELPEPPKKGKLNLNEVLQSKYFFA